MSQISSIKPKVIVNFLERLGFGNQRWKERASHYLMGLSAGFKRFNIESLSLASPQFTYGQNYYFITEAKWNEEELNEKRIAFLNQDKRTRIQPDGLLVIDDTSLLKLAELLIIRAKNRFSQLKHTAFDSWFCKKSVIKTAEEQSFYFDSQLRQDRKSEVIDYYEQRWAIDQFYREVKDNLAFSQFQFSQTV